MRKKKGAEKEGRRSIDLYRKRSTAGGGKKKEQAKCPAIRHGRIACVCRHKMWGGKQGKDEFTRKHKWPQKKTTSPQPKTELGGGVKKRKQQISLEWGTKEKGKKSKKGGKTILSRKMVVGKGSRPSAYLKLLALIRPSEGWGGYIQQKNDTSKTPGRPVI